MTHSISVSRGQRAAFIADLHLQPQQDDRYRLALKFLDSISDFDSLFILGDLFEYWIGDDAGVALYEPAIRALNKLANNGCKLTVFLGNRDFLLGQQFADASGVSLNRCDETVIDLAGSNVLLMHGDTLCVDDTDYQRFRNLVRHPDWQRDFLSLNTQERLEKAQQLRAQSKSAGRKKDNDIMDVNAAEVVRVMEINNCCTLIHGHTHRPAIHQNSAGVDSRYVVGDWHPDHARYVLFDGQQLSMQVFRG